MANGKRSKPKKEALADSVPVQLVIDLAPDTPSYYANHVEIAVNKHEISLRIAKIPTKPGRAEMAAAEATGELIIDAEMEILIPPTLIKGLIAALETSRQNYETLFGPIREIEQ